MISFIVPAYNEAENIESTIATVRSAVLTEGLRDYEIIIVDDGSTDGTGAVVDALKQRLPELSCIHHSSNLGLGSAIRSAVAVARCPKFMIIPGDNDVHRAFLSLMLAFRDSADLILTVPLNREVRALPRIAVSLLYQLIYMVTFGLFVNYLNGPGIWPTEKAREVGLRANRFSIISEMNVKLLRSGCSFAEVPGYMQRPAGHQRTVTLRNFVEVVRTFMMLIYDVQIGARSRFSRRPTRVLIDFSQHLTGKFAPPATQRAQAS
jgi:glycosyltransferase involved in cell wall biosynthesis